jgi:hypothetical protein
MQIVLFGNFNITDLCQQTECGVFLFFNCLSYLILRIVLCTLNKDIRCYTYNYQLFRYWYSSAYDKGLRQKYGS